MQLITQQLYFNNHVGIYYNNAKFTTKYMPTVLQSCFLCRLFIFSTHDSLIIELEWHSVGYFKTMLNSSHSVYYCNIYITFVKSIIIIFWLYISFNINFAQLVAIIVCMHSPIGFSQRPVHQLLGWAIFVMHRYYFEEKVA